MDKSVRVDYLSFTTRRSVSEVLALFAFLPNPLTPSEKGMYGYNLCFDSASGVKVLYSVDRPDVHVSITGQGCDMGFITLFDLMAREDTVTRIDIALDCFNSGVTCAEIWGFLQRGSYVSVSSSIRQIVGRVREDGHTIYVGSSQSERMLRIYDKGAEQKTGADWLRFEIQLRGASADAFVLRHAKPDTFAKSAMSLLNKQLRLVIDSDQEQKRHLPMTPFWSELTDGAVSLNLQLPIKGKSSAGLIRYVKNATTAIKTLKVMTDFQTFLEDAIDNAKLKKKHIMVQDEIMGVYQVGYSEVLGVYYQDKEGNFFIQ